MNAVDGLRRWKADPVAFVRDNFGVEPDPWQCEILGALVTEQRIAMKACKGPGKTAVLAWCAWWFLVCFLHPKIAATSITGDNLADGLWTEMAKWRARSPFLQRAFTWTKTRIFANDHSETWWMSARTWPRGGDTDSQADTLAGLHADNLMFIIDESGGVPDAVMAAAEAGLANATEGNVARLLQAGNPTHLVGPLYRACTSERHLWHVVEITADPDDPKRSTRVSAEWARQQIEKYGRDNPWVQVNVFGKFPPSSLNSLIGPDEVRAAMARHIPEDQYRPFARVLGVDVARNGAAQSVIFPRQGQAAFTPITMRNADSLQGAGAVARKWADWDAHACFVDGTGGFGAGWVDQLKLLQRPAVSVHFAAKPTDVGRYVNKRAEMWFEMCDWIRNGGALPNIPELVAELTAPVYFFKGDKLQLEDKDQIEARIGRSPDYADALALTFAQPVAAPMDELTRMHLAARSQRSNDYDPYATRVGSRPTRDFDPYARN